MEIVEFMQGNATSFAVAGAVAIVFVIWAKYYDKVEVEKNGTKMTLSKDPQNLKKSTKFHDVANFEKINNKKVKNHKEKYSDKINLKKYDDVKNVGNIKITNNGEVEGGETEVCRIFGSDE